MAILPSCSKLKSTGLFQVKKFIWNLECDVVGPMLSLSRFFLNFQAGRPTTSMVHSSTGDFWTFLGTVLYPFLAIWRLISNFLFSNPPPAQTSVRAAALESSNLASSGNSERRYLFVFSPFAKYVSNAQCLIQNEKFCYGYFAFSLYQGENPTCSGKLNT